MFENTFKNIDDILYKDELTELDYIGQTWIFLRHSMNWGREFDGRVERNDMTPFSVKISDGMFGHVLKVMMDSLIT